MNFRDDLEDKYCSSFLNDPNMALLSTANKRSC